ncbi:MAG: hypothetical protein ACTSVY_16445 [Candidatus Helarchaeota archaeon]
MDVNNKVNYIHLCRLFDEREAKHLLSTIDKINSEFKIEKNVIIIPRKWKATRKARTILKKINDENTIIVAKSPIQRALLKTEAIYDGRDVNNICNTEKEALNKIVSAA